MMRLTLLAFFGLAFVVYWLLTAELPYDRPASLTPVLPNVARLLPTSLQRQSAIGGPERSPTQVDQSQHAVLEWLKTEAARVGQVDLKPSVTVIRFKKKALSLKPSELRTLKDTAINVAGDAVGDERFLAVYIIGLAESASAKEILKDIGQSPVLSTANDRDYSDEIVIRAHALEALLRGLSRRDSIQFLKEFLARTTDPALARHARFWLDRFG